MAKIALSTMLVKRTLCPEGKRKVDLFDTHCKGLLLEVSASGRKTYYLRYQDKRGRTRQLRLADAADVSLGQAKVLAGQLRNQIAMGQDPAEKKAMLKRVPTVTEFIHGQYLPFVRNYKRSWFTDEGLLRCHVEPVWGRRYMDEIRSQDVIRLISNYRQTHAPGTCNRLLTLLRYLFNLAMRWEVPGVTRNPGAGLPLLHENSKRERYLTKEETAVLYAQLRRSKNRMLKYIVPMLIFTGARKREVMDARWEDFDIERRSWRIPMSKSGRARHVPLSEGAVQLLLSIPSMSDCPWVFANPKTKLPYRSFFYAWNAARCRSGLSDVRIHDLRHSFASFLVNAGRSLYVVQQILGHANVKTTQRYSHLAQETLLAAANAAFDEVGFVLEPAAASVHIRGQEEASPR